MRINSCNSRSSWYCFANELRNGWIVVCCSQFVATMWKRISNGFFFKFVFANTKTRKRITQNDCGHVNKIDITLNLNQLTQMLCPFRKTKPISQPT